MVNKENNNGIPVGWEQSDLGHIANFRNGKSSPNRNDSLGYDVFGSNGIIGRASEYNSDEETVVVGRVGSYCGSVYFSRNKCWVTDNAIIGNAKQDNHSEFLYYLLLNLKLNNYRAGSGQPLLNQGILNSLKVIVPVFNEQKSIAKILSDLDAKIELNHRMNETLEQIARAAFKKVTESEKMKKVRLGDILELHYGKALKENLRKSGKIPVYGSNGQVGWHNEKLVDGPGIVVGRKGNPGVVTWVPCDFFPIDTTFYVVPKGEIKSIYYFYFLLSEIDLASLGADSAVPGLNRNMAYGTETTIPSDEIILNFSKQIKPLCDQIYRNETESKLLAKIRDTLLPKLMSGEMRVI